MIQTRYDPEADVLHVSFGPPDAIYDGAQEVAPGIYIEYDTKGRPMGVEITSARWTSEGSQVAQVEPHAKKAGSRVTWPMSPAHPGEPAWFALRRRTPRYRRSLCLDRQNRSRPHTPEDAPPSETARSPACRRTSARA